MGKLYTNLSREYLSLNFTSTCTDMNNLTIPKYGKNDTDTSNWPLLYTIITLGMPGF